MAVGDVMLGRGVLAEPEPLADAAPWLSAADLTLGNLEGVISNQQSTGNSQQSTGNRKWGTENRRDQQSRIMLDYAANGRFSIAKRRL